MGKTTLVASYAEARAIPTLWYLCDRGDADPATLYHFLGAALVRQFPEAPPLPSLAPEDLAKPDEFARRFFRQFFAPLPRGCVLVFDNWQDAQQDATAELLAEAARQVPPGIALLVISRQAPPRQVGTLVATGVVACLPEGALPFDRDELRTLALRRGVTGEQALEALDARCQGWAAGLTLMLDRIGRNQDLEAPPPESLFDYFATQAFEGIPPSGQRTLMLAALPSRVDAWLAARLGADPGAPDLLESLYRRQLFTYRGDVAGGSYHFHALFRDFLRARAREVMGDIGYREAAATAARLLVDAGQVEEAFELACESRDGALAGTLLVRLAPVWMSQGRWQRLAASVDRVPARDAGLTGWMHYWKGVALGATSTSAAQPVLLAACEAFASTDNPEGEALANAELLDCMMRAWALNADMDQCIARLERALVDARALGEMDRAACAAALVAALLHRRPGDPGLPFHADALESLLPAVGDPERQLSMATCLVQYFDCMGQHLRAEAVRAATRRLAESPTLRPVTRFNWWMRMTEHFVLLGEPVHARAAMADTLALLQANDLPDQECLAVGTHCQICIDAGEYDEAERLIALVRDTLVPRYRVYHAMLYWLELWLAIARDDRGRADAAWHELARVPATGVPIYRPFNHPVIVYLCDTGQHAEALSRIALWRDGVAGMASVRMGYEWDLMEAYVRLGEPDPAPGLEILRRAMSAARSSRFLGTHAWIPRMMAFLLARALDNGIEPGYAIDWIRHRRLPPPDADAPGWPRPLAVLTLGRFAILRDGQPLVFRRKAPRRVILMLKMLIAKRGEVAVSHLVEQLWPDLEGDAQHEAFSVNLHRLRRLLGGGDAIRLQDGHLLLDEGACWVDALAFERAVDQSRAGIDRSRRLAVLGLYTGGFLQQDTDEAWSAAARERLRSKFVRHLLHLAQELEESGAQDDALALYRRGAEVDPLVEDFYQGLMRCCLSKRRVGEGLAAYRQLEATLAAELGVEPSDASHRLARSLQGVVSVPYP
jgi:ATP/maltotriose-dependent transcriptional regulator MalT/DNA-binding SARP family transcriptional activator